MRVVRAHGRVDRPRERTKKIIIEKEREKDIIPLSIEVERSSRAARAGSAETISSSVQLRVESSRE